MPGATLGEWGCEVDQLGLCDGATLGTPLSGPGGGRDDELVVLVDGAACAGGVVVGRYDGASFSLSLSLTVCVRLSFSLSLSLSRSWTMILYDDHTMMITHDDPIC